MSEEMPQEIWESEELQELQDAQPAFSDRLKAAMDAKGMRQSDVIAASDKLGHRLGKSQMSQYVSGKTRPRADVAGLLASILGVTPEWLLDGVEPAAATELSAATEPVAVTEPAAATESAAPPGPAPASEPATAPPDPARAPARPAAASVSTSTTDATTSAAASEPEPAAPFPSTSAAAPGQGTAAQKKRSAPMREFKKSSKLDNVLYDVRGPVADEAERMERNGETILKLNIGNPAPFGFRTPYEVVDDMRQQLPDCEGYSDARGLFSARKAIMQYSQIKGLPNVTMDDIYTGNGVSELINLCMQALLDDGDEILIPAPDYPLWTACATLAGGHVVHYLCDEQAEWNPDLDDIESKVTPATKAIVIINPNNPTGALYPREILEGIVDIARRHELMIFSDEIYDRLVMDGGEHISIASLAPDLFCVTFSGLSKSHMIAGYRIGWMVVSGNKRLGRDFMAGVNMLANMRLCSNVPAQSVVQTALWGHQSVNDYLVPGGRIYEQRNYVYEALCDIPGISVVKPKAAFYIFPKMDVKKFNITDDEQFALDLLREKHILITRGMGFNWTEPDHFRIVYLPRMGVLKEAMTDMADFFDHYQQQPA